MKFGNEGSSIRTLCVVLLLFNLSAAVDADQSVILRSKETVNLEVGVSAIAGKAAIEWSTRRLSLLRLQSTLHLIQTVLDNVNEYFVINKVMNDLRNPPFRVRLQLQLRLDELICLQSVEVLTQLLLLKTQTLTQVILLHYCVPHLQT